MLVLVNEELCGDPFESSVMLFLSSGTVNGTTKSTTTGQLQQGITVYNISVILKETQSNAAVSEPKMGRATHNLVENCKSEGEVMDLVPMENSPSLGRARQELNRWPSLSRTSRAGRQRREEVVQEESGEEVEGRMRTDRFLNQRSKNSSQHRRDTAELTAWTDTRKQQRSTSCSVTVCCEEPVLWGHATVTEHSSLPRAVLRRPHRDKAALGRRTISMYGSPVEQQRASQPEQERRLPRPGSVCVLPGSVTSESLAQQLFKRADISVNNQQHRSRKDELRAVDGLSSVGQHSTTPDAILRGRQRSWRTRPVSMTVLELRKIGSDDEIERKMVSGHIGNGGFFKGSFRWKLFGKTPQDRSKDKEADQDANSSHKLIKTDSSKSTFSSLKRSFSLRLKRTRTHDKINIGSEGELKEDCQIKNSVEETTMPPRPFSYLTGGLLPASTERTDDGGMHYFRYHSRGRDNLLEVPLNPPKFASKPVQEEQSLWQYIASRFRRKEQPQKCESKLPENKEPGEKKIEPITIETLAGTKSHKGQGKTCSIA